MSTRVLIVGLGHIGMGYDLHVNSARFVYSHARAFSLHPSFQLVAGVDVDASCRETFEQVYNCPAYSDVDAALLSREADVVVIAGPTPVHADLLRQLLHRTRPRAVLCEKPLAHRVDVATEMVEQCAARAVPLFVNYMRRSVPGVIAVKAMLDSGAMGAWVKGMVWYTKGFFHNGSHLFNLMEYWLGPLQHGTVLDRGRAWGEADTEPDVRATFLRGNVVFLAAREEAFSHYTAELLTDRGRLRYDRGGSQIEWQPVQPDPQFRGYTELASQAQSIHSGMDRYQWHVTDELAGALAGRASNLCTGTQALKTLEAMHGIIETRS